MIIFLKIKKNWQIKIKYLNQEIFCLKKIIIINKDKTL